MTDGRRTRRSEYINCYFVVVFSWFSSLVYTFLTQKINETCTREKERREKPNENERNINKRQKNECNRIKEKEQEKVNEKEQTRQKTNRVERRRIMNEPVK